MTIQRKRVAKRLASGLLAGALALGGLAISGGSVSAKTPSSPSTNRIAGDDRYETAVAIARDALGANGSPTGAIIVSGESPYDALAASVLADKNKPVLLVQKDSVPSSVSDFISDYKSKFATNTSVFYVVGGTSAVSDSVLDALKAAATTAGDTTPPTFTRLAGDDRYLTAKAVASLAGTMTAGDTLILVNGADGRWPDALSAAVLSAEKGWPIVTTGNGGLNDTAKATIDTYLSIPASSASFLIVGGPAVMPTSVEEYLVSEGVAPADIRRVQGADRYQTNFMMNIYLYGTGVFLNGATLDGGKQVALVSGEAPWDALAASGWAKEKNAHIVMTNPTSANATSVTTLVSTLAAVDDPDSIYILGGRNAVADAVRTAAIATATSTNLTTTLSGCTEGSTTVKLTFSSGLSTDEDINGDAVASLVEINGTDGTGNFAVKAGAFDGTRKSYDVTVTSLAVGDEIEFLGIAETTTFGSHTFERSIAGATCTVANDTTGPTVTLKAVTSGATVSLVESAGGANLTGPLNEMYWTLTSNEPLVEGALEGTTDAITWNGALSGGVSVAATALDLTGTTWLLEANGGSNAARIDAATATMSAVDLTFTLNKGAILDLGGNNAASDAQSKFVAADATAPTASLAGFICSRVADASVAHGSLTVTEKADGAGKGKLGAGGNSWKLRIVNQRGLVLPIVSVDSDAKLITVTADSGYHTVADVQTAAVNAGVDGTLGSWDFTVTSGEASSDLVSATTSDKTFSNGTSKCTILLSYSEVAEIVGADNAQGAVAILNGGMAIDGVAGTAQNPAVVLSYGTQGIVVVPATNRLGAFTLTFSATGNGALRDATGNMKAFSINGTLG